MYNDIPRSVLPVEYGGEDGSIKDMAGYKEYSQIVIPNFTDI